MHRLVFEGAVAAGAAYAFWQGFKAWREARVMQDTPTSRVRSAAQGYVELEGHSKLPSAQETRSSLTRTACVWWSFKIETRHNRRGWRTVQSGTSEALFCLEDSTGVCLIDPRGAQVFADAKTVWYGSTAWPEVHIPDGTGVFSRIGDFLLRGDYRYTENRITAGAPLYAIGAFRTLGGVAAEDSESEVNDLLRAWKHDQAGLLEKYDTNHDGVIDENEWNAARAAARQLIEKKHLTAPAAERLNVLESCSDGRPFLLASGDIEGVIRKLRWRARAGIFAFLALVSLLAWLAQNFR